MVDHSSYHGASAHSQMYYFYLRSRFTWTIKQIVALSWYLAPLRCFRKWQLWVTFKDQYFIFRKKADHAKSFLLGFDQQPYSPVFFLNMGTYEEFLMPKWIWRFWRPENTTQTLMRSLYTLITKIFKSRKNGSAKIWNFKDQP